MQMMELEFRCRYICQSKFKGIVHLSSDLVPPSTPNSPPSTLSLSRSCCSLICLLSISSMANQAHSLLRAFPPPNALPRNLPAQDASHPWELSTKAPPLGCSQAPHEVGHSNHHSHLLLSFLGSCICPQARGGGIFFSNRMYTT